MKGRIRGKVFQKVRKTFNRMKLSAQDRYVRDHLVTMNIPPLMARRDAAYERAVRLLRKNIFSYTEEKRIEIYAAVLKLLDIALDTSQQIFIPSKDGEKTQAAPLLQYFMVLSDTVQAAADLVQHELILFEDENTLTGFIGSEISSQFRSTDQIFSGSEVNIYQCISELLDIAEHPVKRNKEYIKKTFSKNDLHRYNKAFMEFENLYSTFCSIDENTDSARLKKEKGGKEEQSSVE